MALFTVYVLVHFEIAFVCSKEVVYCQQNPTEAKRTEPNRGETLKTDIPVCSEYRRHHFMAISIFDSSKRNSCKHASSLLIEENCIDM